MALAELQEFMAKVSKTVNLDYVRETKDPTEMISIIVPVGDVKLILRHLDIVDPDGRFEPEEHLKESVQKTPAEKKKELESQEPSQSW